MNLTRRTLGLHCGTLAAGFAFRPVVALSEPGNALPEDLQKNPRLDGWIQIAGDGTVQVLSGKAELGQGILTALAQIAAEELDVSFARIRMVGPDTTRGPDETYTYSSQSVEQGGAAVRQAAAQARALLISAAARTLGVEAKTLRVEDGTVVARDGRSMSYGEIVSAGADLPETTVTLDAHPKPVSSYRISGQSIPRIDLRSKFTGEASYVQDLRMPGMLFGRAVRPPFAGAKLLELNEAELQRLPGVVAVARDGSYLGVVARREEQAIAALSVARQAARWSEPQADLPDAAKLSSELRSLRGEATVIASVGQDGLEPQHSRRLAANYTRAYLSQASIGPSCAVALYRDGHMRVWSHTQGAYPLRSALALVLGLPAEQVDVIQVPGAGCYGHNGADDVSLDAALMARTVAGSPVKVQWMRDDEFAWAPISPAMTMDLSASLDSGGRIVDWAHAVWSNSHAMRPGQSPGPATNLLAAWYLAKPSAPTTPLRIPQPAGDGDRNAVPVYDLPRLQVVNHLLTEVPIRASSLRTLGAHGNIFAIECFMDELAAAAGRDAIAFRLDHLRDPRGRAVIEAVTRAAHWRPGQVADGQRGRGFAYTRYKTISNYVAVIVDVEVDRENGAIRLLKVYAAVDSGRLINPDGARSQSEGGIVQGLSWALKEEMTFDRTRITSRDWSSYHILSTTEVPDIEVELLDRPDEPPLGAGEGSVAPASAALVNAVSNAIGRRIRELPLSPQRVKAALDGSMNLHA